MRTICFILALLASSGSAFAEVTVDIKHVKMLQTITPEIITQLMTEDGESVGSPVTSKGETVVKQGGDAALLLIKADRDLADKANVILRFRSATCSPAEIDSGSYVITTPGNHAVTVMLFAQNPIGLDVVDINVVVGEPLPPPPPPPPPPPDVPPDRFDNIGQRVAGWANGLPANKAVGGVFLKHANMLFTDQTKTINEISASLVAELTAMPDADKYAELRKNINADLQQRHAISPLDRATLGDIYKCVALGLGVAP